MKPEDYAKDQLSHLPDMTDEEIRELKEKREREIAQRRERSNYEMQKIMQLDKTIRGRVKYLRYFFNEDGSSTGEINFAFITPYNNLLNDLFVHMREVEPWRDGFKELHVGDIVDFKIGHGHVPGKWQAVQVSIDREATEAVYAGKRSRGVKIDPDNFNR